MFYFSQVFLYNIRNVKYKKEHDNTAYQADADCSAVTSVSSGLDQMVTPTLTPSIHDQSVIVTAAKSLDRSLRFWPDLQRRLYGAADILPDVDHAVIRNASLFAVIAAATLISKRFHLSI